MEYVLDSNHVREYIAFDGTSFRRELDCLKYEREHRADEFRARANELRGEVALYNIDGEELADVVDAFHADVSNQRVYYIRVDTERALDFVDELVAIYGYNDGSFVWRGHPELYVYDRYGICDDIRWVPASSIKHVAEDISNKFNF